MTDVVEDAHGGEAVSSSSDQVNRSLSLPRPVVLGAQVLVVVQIIAVLVFGAITAVRYPLWSPTDEGAHFENVIYITQHGSYPVLGQAPAGEQELAISQGIYPKHTTIDPRQDGLGGLAYEAFQPPLYYYVAAPITYLSGDYRTKAFLLRFFGLFLLSVSIALLARLSRLVLKDRWLLGLAGGMVMFLLPGTVLRMVNISNENLALPLGLLILIELWVAWEREESWRLVIGGVLIGLGLLTDLFLGVLVPVFALVALSILRTHRSRRDLQHVALGGVLTGLLLLPWLIFNEVKYHALTATALAKEEQIAIINPTHARYTLAVLPGSTFHHMMEPLWPKVWAHLLDTHTVLALFGTVLQVALVPGALLLAVLLGRRILSGGYWLLILPWVSTVVVCWVLEIGGQWPVLNGRYMLPALAPLALFEVAALMDLTRGRRSLLIGIGAMTLFLLILWVHVVPTVAIS